MRRHIPVYSRIRSEVRGRCDEGGSVVLLSIGVEEGHSRSGHGPQDLEKQCDSDDDTMPLCKARRIDLN